MLFLRVIKKLFFAVLLVVGFKKKIGFKLDGNLSLENCLVVKCCGNFFNNLWIFLHGFPSIFPPSSCPPLHHIYTTLASTLFFKEELWVQIKDYVGFLVKLKRCSWEQDKSLTIENSKWENVQSCLSIQVRFYSSFSVASPLVIGFHPASLIGFVTQRWFLFLSEMEKKRNEEGKF